MEVPTFEKIVVPLDSSDLSFDAVPWSLSIAEHEGSFVDLISVVRSKDSSDDWTTARSVIAEAAKDLHSITGRVNQFVLDGQPANCIVEHSVRAGADLIVMVSHTRGRLMRRLLGSVTADVLRRAQIPVMIIKPEQKFSPFERVILALDGTEVGMAGLGTAAELARLFNVPLTVIHVTESKVSGETEDELAKASADLKTLPAKAEIFIERGNPREEIVNITDESPGSVLVMASAAATGFGPNRRTSVTNHVIENSSSPTVVVPPILYLGPVVE